MQASKHYPFPSPPSDHFTLVLYYSNAILSKALPTFAPYVSLTITVVNFLMTFPPIFLIEVCTSIQPACIPIS